MKELLVDYRIECPAEEVDARARALAVEQSVEMPPEAIGDPDVRERFVGRVEEIVPEGPRAYRVRIGLAVASTGLEAGQLLNMLFGNSSLQPEITLTDFALPDPALRDFGGPRHGIAGLRLLLGVPRGAFTCSALKPLGSTPAQLAALAGALARAGIDLIKDDHGLADRACAPFAQRVRAVQAALAEVRRAGGRTALYAPTVAGGPRRVIEQLRIARDEGVRAVLLAPMIGGPGTMHELARETDGPAIIAHPAMAGAARIAPPVLLGRLFRLCGADATIFPNHGGRFSYSAQTCAEIADRARGPLGGLRACLPVPAGGMHPERVGEMLAFYGEDVMLLIGGALLAAPDGIEAAARRFVSAVRRDAP